jgi:hypothetical protein
LLTLNYHYLGKKTLLSLGFTSRVQRHFPNGTICKHI